jgi:hypothetical protein
MGLFGPTQRKNYILKFIANLFNLLKMKISAQLRRILFYLLGIGTIGGAPALLMTYGDFLWGEEPIKETPIKIDSKVPLSEAVEALDSLEEDLWDDIFKTSDLEEERGTRPGKNFQYPNKANDLQAPAPKGAIRVGCICMDDIKEDRRGRGACSGHAGVRFWLYKMPDGEILRHPTARHHDHPTALVSEEKKNLDAHNPSPKKKISYFSPNKSEMLTDSAVLASESSKEKEGSGAKGHQRFETESRDEIQKRKTAEQIGHLGFYDLIVMLMICITVAYITQVLFLRR